MHHLLSQTNSDSVRINRQTCVMKFNIWPFSLLILITPFLTAQTIERLPFEPIPNHDEGIIYSPTFSSSMAEVYFVKREGEWGKTASKSTIYYARNNNGKWTKAVPASFSGEFSDNAPHLSPNGQTLYFTSNRGSTSTDIWMVEKNSSGQWGEPSRLDDTINSPSREYSPRITENGDLYFASDREGGLGQGDVYIAKKSSNGFNAPVNLGAKVNTSTGEWNLCISRDGQVLIVEASGRPENKTPYGDLYISFNKDGRWTNPQNIRELNTTGSDLYAVFTSNNQYLYYASSNTLESPTVNIYKVKIGELLKKYKASSQLD